MDGGSVGGEYLFQLQALNRQSLSQGTEMMKQQREEQRERVASVIENAISTIQTKIEAGKVDLYA